MSSTIRYEKTGRDQSILQKKEMKEEIDQRIESLSKFYFLSSVR